MTPLGEALQTLGLDGELSHSGRWLILQGECCLVYVVAAARGSGYYTWCGYRHARTVEFYRDATEAILSGLRRAHHPG